MRDKQDILEQAHKDITNDRYKQDAPLWLQYRLLEVLIDIRDELSALTIILGSVEKIAYRAG